jgi:hypothetical protein
MNNVAEPGGVLQALSAPTTAANRAWVSTRLQMSGGANSDSVILKWTNTMSTYEGTKAWDNVLLPEQFDEHYVALTNLFLTPWTYWTWTDSIAATNQAAVSWTNLVTALYTIDEATLFDDYSTNATTDNMECIDEATIQGSATWWLLFSGLPWFTVDVPPLLADSVVWTSNLVAGIPPQFTYSLNFSASIVEAASGNTWFDYQESSAIPETADWYWSASREGSVTDHSLLGVSTKSRVTAINLNTTVPHRMHVYAKYDFGQFTNNTPYYHRIEIVPSSGFSTDPTLSSSYIDLTTNVAGFSATPVTSSAPLGCWASLIGDIVYTNFGETYSDITMTTQTLSWATSVVASVTTTNTYNPETLTIERDIYHKSNTLYTAEFSPTELSGRAIHWGIYYPIRMWETTNGGSGVQSCGTNYTMVEDTFSASTNTINTTATEFAANPDYTLYPDDYLENGTNVSETVRVWTVSNTNGDLAYDTVTVEYPSTLCGIDVDPPYGPGENQPDTWDQFELAFYMDYLRGYYPTAEGSNWVFGAVSCCDLGSGYNHGDMSGSATSSVSISSGFVNTVDVKVLIEWDH